MVYMYYIYMYYIYYPERARFPVDFRLEATTISPFQRLHDYLWLIYESMSLNFTIIHAYIHEYIHSSNLINLSISI